MGQSTPSRPRCLVMAPDASGAGPLAIEVETAGYEILGPFLSSEDAMQAMDAGPPHAAVLGGAPAAHLGIVQELR